MPGKAAAKAAAHGPGAAHSYDAQREDLARAALDETPLNPSFANELSPLLQETVDDFVTLKTGVVPTLILSRGT